MNDYWIMSKNVDLIHEYLSNYENVLGPAHGLAAIEENTTIDPPVEAREAMGDEDTYYAGIRAESLEALPTDIQMADKDLCQKIVGIWA